MGFWTIFWAALLAVALTIFAGLAVVVTIGGFFDVRTLLRTIDRKHAEEGPAVEKEDPGRLRSQ
jgi:hypothetical protein